VLREVGRNHPMAEAYRAFGLFAEAEHGLERRRLAGAVRPDEPDVLAAFEREARVGQQSLVAGSHAQAVRLDHRSAAARRLEEVEAERTTLASQELQLSAGVRALGLEPLDLRQLGLRLLGLALLVAEPLDETLEPHDVRAHALGGLRSVGGTGRLLEPPDVPGPREEEGAAGLELEHAGRERPQEPARPRDKDVA